jgi:hypothetical protein
MPLLFEHFALFVLAHLFAAFLDYASHVLPFMSLVNGVFYYIDKCEKGKKTGLGR